MADGEPAAQSDGLRHEWRHDLSSLTVSAGAVEMFEPGKIRNAHLSRPNGLRVSWSVALGPDNIAIGRTRAIPARGVLVKRAKAARDNIWQEAENVIFF